MPHKIVHYGFALAALKGNAHLVKRFVACLALSVCWNTAHVELGTPSIFSLCIIFWEWDPSRSIAVHGIWTSIYTGSVICILDTYWRSVMLFQDMVLRRSDNLKMLALLSRHQKLVTRYEYQRKNTQERRHHVYEIFRGQSSKTADQVLVENYVKSVVKRRSNNEDVLRLKGGNHGAMWGSRGLRGEHTVPPLCSLQECVSMESCILTNFSFNFPWHFVNLPCG